MVLTLPSTLYFFLNLEHSAHKIVAVQTEWLLIRVVKPDLTHLTLLIWGLAVEFCSLIKHFGMILPPQAPLPPSPLPRPTLFPSIVTPLAPSKTLPRLAFPSVCLFFICCFFFCLFILLYYSSSPLIFVYFFGLFSFFWALVLMLARESNFFLKQCTDLQGSCTRTHSPC